MDLAALTTAATLQAMSSSALTRSRSGWSMMAISPGASRLTRALVFTSTRAVARMPGGASALPRLTCGILTVGTFIAHSSCQRSLGQLTCYEITVCQGDWGLWWEGDCSAPGRDPPHLAIARRWLCLQATTVIS